MSISTDNVFKVLITSLLSLIVWIGSSVVDNQKDISRRLRIVELNQARIMERIGVKQTSNNPDPLQGMSIKAPP